MIPLQSMKAKVKLCTLMRLMKKYHRGIEGDCLSVFARSDSDEAIQVLGRTTNTWIATSASLLAKTTYAKVSPGGRRLG
jgi:hypothetical protein